MSVSKRREMVPYSFSFPMLSSRKWVNWARGGRWRGEGEIEWAREMERSWGLWILPISSCILFLDKKSTKVIVLQLVKSAQLILRPFFIYIWMLSKVCDNVYLVYLVMWFCVGSELLSGHESDRCHSAHVHEWGRCILGLITATDQSETCHAWWVSLSDSVCR